jgi:hypothetical protein
VCSKSDPTVVPWRVFVPGGDDPGMTGGGTDTGGGCAVGGRSAPSLFVWFLCALALVLPRLARKRN